MSKSTKKLDKEEGFAVVLALMIILILSVLGLSLMTIAAYQYMDLDRTKPSNRAFDLADCGLSYAEAYLAQDIDFPTSSAYDPGPKELSPGISDSKFDIIITKLPHYQYRIVSTGMYQDNKSSKNYNRTLEEVIEWKGAKGYFDAFTYTLFSKDGDVILDTGSIGVLSCNGMTVTGNGEHAIYAGNNVTLKDVKLLLAGGLVADGGTLSVIGDVNAGNNINVETTSLLFSGLIYPASVNVVGDITAGSNVTVSSSTGLLGASNALVTGSINAGGNVTLGSTVGGLCYASTKVAQTSNTGVNAGGKIDISATAFIAAACDTIVGTSGAPSSVKAMGNSRMTATTAWIGATPKTRVWGDLKNNGTAFLSATGLGGQESRIDGVWQHGSCTPPSGNCIISGGHFDTNPNIQTSDIASVPDVQFPEPDWRWYKTTAISQGNYPPPGDYTVDVEIGGDPSSMWVLYVRGNVNVENVIFTVAKHGVIVCEGDVKITHLVQFWGAGNRKTTYQVIAKGNVIHENSWTLNPNAKDEVFIYTDGSYDSNKNGIADDGYVKYDLGYFRDIIGQITCKGDITADVGSLLSFDQQKISYASPIVAAPAWPIPFKTISFREL
jgi:hypothetical protein